ncbi:MAG: DUF4350 domain-containing protein [Coleofasciculaceae cyanobacterium]
MKFSKRQLWLFSAIAVSVVILITLVAAPAGNKLNSGSTYGRAPDGYGAWYAFMSEQGTPVKRWQKPFQDLAENEDKQNPITLLRVHSRLTNTSLLSAEQKWVERGNTLVILGVRQPVTEADFSTMQDSPVGKIKIDTRRRQKKAKQEILGDRFGAIIWQDNFGKGKVVFVTTPHLAANAYQDFSSNYHLLAELVTADSQTVWVDEYIHGYKDLDVIKEEAGENIWSYLAKTPLSLALLQVLIILGVAIWAGNRRFGKPLSLTTPVVDNSKAYIQALAGVLQKANSSEFVLEAIGKEEKLQLQKALGLGSVALDNQSLLKAWVQQTGRPAQELQQLLQVQSHKGRVRESTLLTWLKQWQDIHRHLY